MSNTVLPDPIEYDTNRLNQLLDLWADKNRDVSSLFIAMNIFDFTGRVHRHLNSGYQFKQDQVCKAEAVYRKAEEIIGNDQNLSRSVNEGIRFDEFHMKLQEYLDEFEEGLTVIAKDDHELYDIVDHFFGSELIIRSLERFNQVDNSLKEPILAFRQAFSDAVDQSVDLAEQARDYAEMAPGGPDMEPWPELLDSAPDQVFDLLSHIETPEKQANDTPEQIDLNWSEIYVEKLAAKTTRLQFPEKVLNIFNCPEFTLTARVVGDQLFIDIGNLKDLDLAPELLIYLNNKEINREGIPSNNIVIRYTMGTYHELKGKILTFKIPGSSLELPLVLIS